jgi:hypothetical protein
MSSGFRFDRSLVKVCVSFLDLPIIEKYIFNIFPNDLKDFSNIYYNILSFQFS